MHQRCATLLVIPEWTMNKFTIGFQRKNLYYHGFSKASYHVPIISTPEVTEKSPGKYSSYKIIQDW